MDKMYAMDKNQNFFTRILLSLLMIFLDESESFICPGQCSCSTIKKLEGVYRKVSCGGEQVDATPIYSIEELQPISNPAAVAFLDLSGNRLESFKEDTFLDFHNLKRLNVSNNNILDIEPGAFNGLESLQRLDLSSNKMTSINSTVFNGLKNLEKIYLAENDIKTFEAGIFDNLPQLKKVFLGTRQLRCDCHFQWIVSFLEENKAVRFINSTCATPLELKGKAIKDLKESDLHCNWPLEFSSFQISPSINQIVFQGDKLPFECKASLIADSTAEITWYRMGKAISTNASMGVYVHQMQTPDSRHSVVSSLMLEKLSIEDSGVWKCQLHSSHGNKTLSVNIVVIPYDAVICPEITIKTNKGVLEWRKAVSSTTPSVRCPYSLDMQVAEPYAYLKCNNAGEWQDLDDSACAYESQVTRILKQTAEVNSSLLITQSSILESIINNPVNISDKDDVKFIAVIVERLLDVMSLENYKQLQSTVLHLASILINADEQILYDAQNSFRACSRIVEVIESLAVKQLDPKPTVTGLSQNVAFYGYLIKQTEFRGLYCQASASTSSKYYTSSNFQCDTDLNHADNQQHVQTLASISIPVKIFSYVRCLLNECDHTLPFKIEVIVYRKSTLFPQKSRNSSSGARLIPTPVISAKIVQGGGNVHIENSTDPVVITLKTGDSDVSLAAPQAVYWDFSLNDGFGGWLPYGCRIVKEGKNLTVSNCRHLTNFAISQAVITWTSNDWISQTFSMSPMVYAGSIVLVLSLLTTAITYMVCHSTLYMPKKLKHCVPNFCLALVFLCITYTIGVKETNRDPFCKIIGISIHYFSLCVLIWVNIMFYVVYKKFKKSKLPPKPPDPDAPKKPILGIYLLGWGLALILCGIVAAINSFQHYTNPHYCFLLHGARKYAFYVPVALLVTVNMGLLICMSYAIRSLKTTSKNSNEPETEEIQVIDDGDLTNIDSMTPTSTNMDSVKPTMAANSTYDTRSHLSNFSMKSNSVHESIIDVQYQPCTQLTGMVVLLLLYIFTWSAGALAVALPFHFIHQELVFNCLYLICSLMFAVFVIVFLVFGRNDGKEIWRRFCCCYKSKDNDVNVSHGNYTHRNIAFFPTENGHIRHSSVSLEGSHYSNRSYSGHKPAIEYHYRPIYPFERGLNLSVMQSNPPSILESSLTVPEYPNFYNAKQNGIAKKYWQKHRHKNRIIQLNRDLINTGATGKDTSSKVSFDESSDQITHVSLEIQLKPNGAMIANGLQLKPSLYTADSLIGSYSVNIDGPKDSHTGQLLVPYDRCKLAPISGLSSPPSTTVLLPPDGGSMSSVPPVTTHTSLPKHKTYHSAPQNSNVTYLLNNNRSVPRLRDFDGKSSTSHDTRPLSIDSDIEQKRYSVEKQKKYSDKRHRNKSGDKSDNSGKNITYRAQNSKSSNCSSQTSEQSSKNPNYLLYHPQALNDNGRSNYEDLQHMSHASQYCNGNTPSHVTSNTSAKDLHNEQFTQNILKLPYVDHLQVDNCHPKPTLGLEDNIATSNHMHSLNNINVDETIDIYRSDVNTSDQESLPYDGGGETMAEDPLGPSATLDCSLHDLFLIKSSLDEEGNDIDIEKLLNFSTAPIKEISNNDSNDINDSRTSLHEDIWLPQEAKEASIKTMETCV